jgi:hypothetical protein
MFKDIFRKNILLFILIIFLFIPTSQSINAIVINNSDNTILISSNDVPIWNEDDYWKYKINIKGHNQDNSISFDLSFSDLKITVQKVKTENYELTYSADVEGSGTIAGILNGNLRNTQVNGELIVRKSDLSIIETNDVDFIGKIGLLNINVDIYNCYIQEPFEILNFPLYTGKSWTTQETSIYHSGYINKPLILEGNLEDYLPSMHISQNSFSCESQENKLGYNSYKISGNNYDFWFSNEAGNIVKLTNKNDIILYQYLIDSDWYFVITDFEITLLDTNYESNSGDISIIKPKPAFCYSKSWPDGMYIPFLENSDEGWCFSVYVGLSRIEVIAESNKADHVKFVLQNDTAGIIEESEKIYDNNNFLYEFDPTPNIGSFFGSVCKLKVISYDSQGNEIGNKLSNNIFALIV